MTFWNLIDFPDPSNLFPQKMFAKKTNIYISNCILSESINIESDICFNADLEKSVFRWVDDHKDSHFWVSHLISKFWTDSQAKQ